MALISEYLAADLSPDASADALAIINIRNLDDLFRIEGTISYRLAMKSWLLPLKKIPQITIPTNVRYILSHLFIILTLN